MADKKIMDRVRDLLAVANHPNTPEAEADTALAMANRLITKHAIDEAILRSKQTEGERRKPTKATIRTSEGSYEFLPMLKSSLEEIAKANRCSAATSYYQTDVYGADEDVAWVDMLFNSIYFSFLSQINPKWETAKSYDENVYILKVAGKKWAEINELSVANGGPDARVTELTTTTRANAERFDHEIIEDVPDGYDRDGAPTYYVKVLRHTNKIKGSMIAAYKREAKRRGDVRLVDTQSHLAYRLSFSEAFRTRLIRRIREMARENKESQDTIPGAAIALASMAEDAQKMMWEDHEELSPEAAAAQAAQAEKDFEARQAMLAAMTPKQRAEFLEREEREWARNLRRREKNTRYYRTDPSAATRGQNAADKVNLNRSAGRTEGAQERAALN